MKNKKVQLPQIDKPIVPLQDFHFVPEVFEDPKGILFDPIRKQAALKEIERAYTQAWMTQKLVEITYQRFLHNDLDKGKLVEDGLKSELARTQNEVRIAEGMLDTIKEWNSSLH